MQRRTSLTIVRLFLAGYLLIWLMPAGLAGTASARPQHTMPKQSHTAVSGTPAIAINPTTVAAGDTIAITGTGFTPSEPVEVQLVATTASISTTYTLATVTADHAGGFTVAKATIPADAPSGSYQVLALALSGTSADRAQVQLTIQAAKPTLSVSPASFAPNDDIKVSGTKFGKNETVSVSLSTTSQSASLPIGTLKTDATGAFTDIPLHVPFGVPAGQLQLVAVGDTSNLQATAPVTVSTAKAAIALNAASALPGDTIAVTGTHFQPGETVTVDLVSLTGTTRLGTAPVNQAGQFTLAAAVIPPNTPEGTVSIVATGSSSKLSGSAQIKIGSHPATLAASPTTLNAGSTIALTGIGFIPGETVSIMLSGGKISPLTLATVVVGTNGTFTAGKLTIPGSIPAGAYTLTASGQSSGRSGSTSLTVQAPPPSAPILSLIGVTVPPGKPAVVSPGGFVQVAGSSFPAGAQVTLLLTGNNAAIKLGTVAASSAGTFGPLGLTFPAISAAGTYTLESDVNGGKVASLPLQVVLRSPHLAVSSGTLAAGRQVTVTGTGYAPGEQIVIALDGVALPTVPSTVLANANGSFSARFVVPQTITNGSNTLAAAGVASRATATLTLQASLGVASRWYFANGDTTGNHRTTITMLNPSGNNAHVRMEFLYQAAPANIYTQVVPAHSVASVDLALAAGYGRRISTIVQADQKISAVSTITYGNADTASTAGASGPAKLWYLAEGYDNLSFTDEVVIMNPSTSAATIDVRFLPFNNRPVQETRFVMQPRSNIRIDASQYIAKQSFSTIVTADQSVVVERAMHFGLNGRGADDKIGSNSAATVWYFAAGTSAADRQTFFTILNPNQASPAAVTATFFDRAGKPVGTKTIEVDALHRGNIKLNDVLAEAQVATVMTSNVPVVIERPVYQSSANLSTAPSGGTAFGRNSGGLSWAFPGLSTANGDASSLYLFNPGVKTVNVAVTYYGVTGATVAQSLVLPANGDVVVDVNGVAGLPPGPIGAVVTSTNGLPFIAEETVSNTTTQRFGSMQGIAQ